MKPKFGNERVSALTSSISTQESTGPLPPFFRELLSFTRRLNAAAVQRALRHAMIGSPAQDTAQLPWAAASLIWSSAARTQARGVPTPAQRQGRVWRVPRLTSCARPSHTAPHCDQCVTSHRQAVSCGNVQSTSAVPRMLRNGTARHVRGFAMPAGNQRIICPT